MRPEPPNHLFGDFLHNADHEQDDWQVGFEVQMNVIGVVEPDLLLTTDDDSDGPDEIPGDNHQGYQLLAGGPDTTTPTVDGDDHSAHCQPRDNHVQTVETSRDIQLDEAKIVQIRNVMSGFVLPLDNVPNWAKNMAESEWIQLIGNIASRQ